MHVFGIDFNQVEKAGRAQTSGSDENVMTIDAKERDCSLKEAVEQFYASVVFAAVEQFYASVVFAQEKIFS